MVQDPPVTVDVIQQVRPGCEPEFEALLTQILTAASHFEGHLGVSVFRPSASDQREYRVIFKFDRLEHLQAWEQSTIRQKLIARARKLTVGEGTFSILTGLETWFTLPARPGLPPPPRYKMVLASGSAIWVIQQILGLIPSAWVEPLPPWMRTIVFVFATTGLMTYGVMPRMTKLLAGWLYSRQ